MSDTSADDTSHYEGALLEEIRDQLSAVLEGQASLVHVPAQLQDVGERLDRIESDVKVIKAAVTDQTHQLDNHEHRITRLEQKAA